MSYQVDIREKNYITPYILFARGEIFIVHQVKASAMYPCVRIGNQQVLSPTAVFRLFFLRKNQLCSLPPPTVVPRSEPTATGIRRNPDVELSTSHYI